MPFFGEDVVEFADFVLRLRDGHAVARNDDHRVRGGKNRGGVFGGGALDRALFLGARGGGLHLAKGSEQHVGEGAVHGLAHDDREDEAGSAVERARNDQDFVVEHEAEQRGGEAGIGVQERDDRGHVRAADGRDQHDSEDQRDSRS